MVTYSGYFMQASRLAGILEHCGITFSWGTEFGKGGPILAAKIGPGGPFLAADRFFRYSPSGSPSTCTSTKRLSTYIHVFTP